MCFTKIKVRVAMDFKKGFKIIGLKNFSATGLREGKYNNLLLVSLVTFAWNPPLPSGILCTEAATRGVL